MSILMLVVRPGQWEWAQVFLWRLDKVVLFSV